MSGRQDLEHQGQDQNGQSTIDVPPSPLEWGARLVSVGVVLALIAFLTFQALQGSTPVDIQVAPQFERVQAVGGAYQLPVDVTNVSTESAIELQLTVVLTDDAGETVDERDLTIALIGPGEQITVVAVFAQDPRRYRVEVETRSFIAG